MSEAPQTSHRALGRLTIAGMMEFAEHMDPKDLEPYREYPWERDYNRGNAWGGETGPLDAAHGYWDNLRDQIQREGFHDPVVLDYNPDTGHGYISEGNHRIGIAKELGIPVPTMVMRTYSDFGRHPASPITEPGQYNTPPPYPGGEPQFPQYSKPSYIGLPTVEAPGRLNKQADNPPIDPLLRDITHDPQPSWKWMKHDSATCGSCGWTGLKSETKDDLCPRCATPVSYLSAPPDKQPEVHTNEPLPVADTEPHWFQTEARSPADGPLPFERVPYLDPRAYPYGKYIRLTDGSYIVGDVGHHHQMLQAAQIPADQVASMGFITAGEPRDMGQSAKDMRMNWTFGAVAQPQIIDDDPEWTARGGGATAHDYMMGGEWMVRRPFIYHSTSNTAWLGQAGDLHTDLMDRHVPEFDTMEDPENTHHGFIWQGAANNPEWAEDADPDHLGFFEHELDGEHEDRVLHALSEHTGVPYEREYAQPGWRFGEAYGEPEHQLNWTPGYWGKAFQLPDGQIHTWNTDDVGNPRHQQYWHDNVGLGRNPMEIGLPSSFWEVKPNGELLYDNGTNHPDPLLRADPRLKPETDPGTWRFGHVISWTPGSYGRALIHNGEIHAWNDMSEVPNQEITHLDYMVQNGLDHTTPATKPSMQWMYVDPDGTVVGSDNDQAMAQVAQAIGGQTQQEQAWNFGDESHDGQQRHEDPGEPPPSATNYAKVARPSDGKELCILCPLDKDTVHAIHEWAENEDAFKDAELEDPSDYHITCLYAHDGYTAHKDEDWHKGDESYHVRCTGLDHFDAKGDSHKDMQAVVLRLEAPELSAYANKIMDEGEEHGLDVSRFPGGYKPHITVAYVPKEIKDIEVPEFAFDTKQPMVSPPRSDHSAKLAGNVITWTPGKHGRALVDSAGNVHAWNGYDEGMGRELIHSDYMADKGLKATPAAYYYIDADGTVRSQNDMAAKLAPQVAQAIQGQVGKQEHTVWDFGPEGVERRDYTGNPVSKVDESGLERFNALGLKHMPEPAWTFSKVADYESYEEWSPGQPGKAILYEDGDVQAWMARPGAGDPHHWDIAPPTSTLHRRVIAYVHITPDGHVNYDGPGQAARNETRQEVLERVAEYIGGTADLDWRFAKLAEQLQWDLPPSTMQWTPGNHGKAFQSDLDGIWHTWNTGAGNDELGPLHDEYDGTPSHYQKAHELGLTPGAETSGHMLITPDGGIYGGMGDQQAALAELDPNLNATLSDRNQRYDWNRDKPEWNFGSISSWHIDPNSISTSSQTQWALASQSSDPTCTQPAHSNLHQDVKLGWHLAAPEDYDYNDYRAWPWQPGKLGKFIIMDDGQVHLWDSQIGIHHAAVAHQLGLTDNPRQPNWDEWQGINQMGGIDEGGNVSFVHRGDINQAADALHQHNPQIPGGQEPSSSWSFGKTAAWGQMIDTDDDEQVPLEPWAKGHSGKAYLYGEPQQVMAWKTTDYETPHHSDVADALGHTAWGHAYIEPNGSVTDYGMHSPDVYESIAKAIGGRVKQRGWSFGKTAGQHPPFAPVLQMPDGTIYVGETDQHHTDLIARPDFDASRKGVTDEHGEIKWYDEPWDDKEPWQDWRWEFGDRPDTQHEAAQNIMYHVAPQVERQQIQTQGLQPSQPREGLPVGVYLFADVNNAYHFAEYREESERENYGEDASAYDVWTVDTAGLALHSDPDIDAEDEFQQEYPVQPLSGVYVTQPIEPERISLVQDQQENQQPPGEVLGSVEGWTIQNTLQSTFAPSQQMPASHSCVAGASPYAAELSTFLSMVPPEPMPPSGLNAGTCDSCGQVRATAPVNINGAMHSLCVSCDPRQAQLSPEQAAELERQQQSAGQIHSHQDAGGGTDNGKHDQGEQHLGPDHHGSNESGQHNQREQEEAVIPAVHGSVRQDDDQHNDEHDDSGSRHAPQHSVWLGLSNDLTVHGYPAADSGWQSRPSFDMRAPLFIGKEGFNRAESHFEWSSYKSSDNIQEEGGWMPGEPLPAWRQGMQGKWVQAADGSLHHWAVDEVWGGPHHGDVDPHHTDAGYIDPDGAVYGYRDPSEEERAHHAEIARQIGGYVQDRDAWKFGSHSSGSEYLQWEPGMLGKGFLDTEGRLHTFEDDENLGDWTHAEQARKRGVRIAPMTGFYMDVDGHVHGVAVNHRLVNQISAQEPRLEIPGAEQWKFGASEPPTEDPAKYWSALKLKDGSFRVWSPEQGAHAVYMHMNGITPEQVESYWSYAPPGIATFAPSGWHNLTPKYENSYHAIYNELENTGDAAQYWRFGHIDPDEIVPWQPGVNGKGLVFKDNSTYLWAVNDAGQPHHDEVWPWAKEKHGFPQWTLEHIDPEGNIEGDPGFKRFRPAVEQAGLKWNEPDEYWRFGSLKQSDHQLGWVPGEWGKAAFDKSGDFHSWPLSQYSAHHIYEMAHGLEFVPPYIDITPHGEARTGTGGQFTDQIAQIDPRLTVSDKGRGMWNFGTHIERSDYGGGAVSMDRQAVIYSPKTDTLYVGAPGGMHSHLMQQNPNLDHEDYYGTLAHGEVTWETRIPPELEQQLAGLLGAQIGNKWHFGAADPRTWQPGVPGKGIWADGQLYHWPTGSDSIVSGAPHHLEKWVEHGLGQIGDLPQRMTNGSVMLLGISPDGSIRDVGRGMATPDEIFQADPRLKRPDTSEWRIGGYEPPFEITPWTPGSYGKATVAPTGHIVHWKIDPSDESPHHADVMVNGQGYYYINPDGALESYRPEDPVEEVSKGIPGTYALRNPAWKFGKPLTPLTQQEYPGEVQTTVYPPVREDSAYMDRRPFMYDHANQELHIGGWGDYHNDIPLVKEFGYNQSFGEIRVPRMPAGSTAAPVANWKWMLKSPTAHQGDDQLVERALRENLPEYQGKQEIAQESEPIWQFGSTIPSHRWSFGSQISRSLHV